MVYVYVCVCVHVWSISWVAVSLADRFVSKCFHVASVHIVSCVCSQSFWQKDNLSDHFS